MSWGAKDLGVIKTISDILRSSGSLCGDYTGKLDCL